MSDISKTKLEEEKRTSHGTGYTKGWDEGYAKGYDDALDKFKESIDKVYKRLKW